MGKRIISVFLSLMLAAVLCAPAFASEKKQTVRVGFFEMEGFFHKDGDGGYDGYGYEFMVEMAKYANWELEFVEGDFDGLQYKLADDKTVDLLLGVYRYEEYKDYFEYSTLSIGTGCSMLTTRADNAALSYGDYDALSGARIGFLTDRYKCDEFRLLAENNNIAYTEVMYATPEILYNALAADDVDAIVANDVFVSENEKLIASFSYQNYYAITRKGSPLIQEVNDSIEHITMNYPQFQSELYAKHYIRSGKGAKAVDVSDYLTPQEQAYAATAKPLVVGISKYIMTDEESGFESCMAASVIQMYKEIATQTGLQFSFTPVNDIKEAISLANSGEIDIIGVFPEKVSLAQDNNIILTSPYMAIDFDYVRNKNKAVGDAPTISLRRGLYYNGYITEKNSASNIMYEDSYYGAVAAVDNGEADTAIINRYIAEELLASTDFNNVYSISSAYSQKVACGISKNSSPLLISVMNKGIACFSAEEMTEIIEKNRTHNLSAPTLISFISTHPVASIIFTAVFVLIIGFLILAVVNQRKTKKERNTKDLLTSLSNTDGFLRSGQKLLDVNPCSAFVLSSLNIKHFSYISGALGLERTNEMLRHIADALRSELSGQFVLARGEGDHFIALYECLNTDTTNQFIERIQTELNNYEHSLADDYSLQLYSGSVPIPVERPHFTLRELLEQSLAAQRSIRDSSARNTFFQSEMMKAEEKRKQLLKEFSNAIDSNEFRCFLQPIHSLRADEKITGAELLTRWVKSDNTIVYPDEFINDLVSCNAIIRFDEYVLNYACEFITKNKNAAWMSGFALSVNISNASVLEPGFAEKSISLKKKNNIPDRKIILEFSEKVVFSNPEQCTELFRRLQGAGFLCAIDNLGSGSSSLRLLGELAPDEIKLDRSLFAAGDERTERHNALIAAGFLNLADACSISSTATGVDRVSHLNFLRAGGCRRIQGYIYAKPMEPESFLVYATNFGRAVNEATSDEKPRAYCRPERCIPAV